MVATVLDLHEHTRQAGMKSFDQMRCHFGHRHDVRDSDLSFRWTVTKLWRIERRSRRAPGLGTHLVIVAEHAIDFAHLGEHLRLGLRGTASDDDFHIRLFATKLTDGLAG